MESTVKDASTLANAEASLSENSFGFSRATKQKNRMLSSSPTWTSQNQKEKLAHKN